MSKFRKKPVIIEAFQFNGGFSFDEMLVEWGDTFANVAKYKDGELTIMTFESHKAPLTASLRDWIIKGVQGEFYPCKPDIFNSTYDPVIE